MIEQVRPWYDDSLRAQARARVQEQLTNDFEMFVEHATQEECCFLSHVLGDANSVADLFEGLP